MGVVFCKTNEIMRKTILTIVFAAVAFAASAQPRALGVRIGVTGIEADYQHDMSKNQFLQGNLGLDYGVLAGSQPGVKATAIYNFIWARPAWTNQGTWAMYAGPGASMGYVYDSAHYKVGQEIVAYKSPGFMLGVCAQVGVEYTFWFPMQVSVDLRPTVGMHVDNGYSYEVPGTDGVNITHKSKSRVGLFDGGLLGFCPHISVRYRF